MGQGYDGGLRGHVRGEHSGVAARIKANNKSRFFMCTAMHNCINLVLADSTKSVPESETFFSLLQKLYVYMSGSYVHQKWLSVQKEMYQGAPRDLQRLSDTRWACRYQACKNIKDRLPAVLRVLHDIDVRTEENALWRHRVYLPNWILPLSEHLSSFKKSLERQNSLQTCFGQRLLI